MNVIFYWTGAVVCLVFMLVVLWLLIEVGVGFVAACSFMRYIRASRRLEGVKWKRWWHPILSFCDKWWQLIGHRKGATRWSNDYGYWAGIGDWTARPKPERLYRVYLEQPGDPLNVIEFACWAETPSKAAEKARTAHPGLQVSEVLHPFDRARSDS
jgi:hypothetical protein